MRVPHCTRARALLLVVVLLVGAPLGALAESRSTKNLNAIADDYSAALDQRLTRPVFTPRANAAWMKKIDHFSRRLSHIKTKNLDQQSRITFRMLRNDLRAQREYLTEGWANRDINGTESPLHTIVSSVDPASLRTVNDWRWAIKTLRHSTRFVDSYTVMLEKGIKNGHTQSAGAVRSAISALDVMTNKTDSPFLALEKHLTKSLAGHSQLPTLRRELRDAVRNDALPAHRRLRSFLEKTYLPRASKLGSDRAAYLHAMKNHLGANHASPEQIHRWGQKEVHRLRGQLVRAARKIDPKVTDASLDAFMKQLNRSKKSKFASGQEAIRAAEKELAKSRELARAHVPVPRSTVEVRPVAKHQESTVAAQYYLTDGNKGVMEINTGRLLGSLPKRDLATLVTHEVYAGHHLAALRAANEKRLPSYRANAAVTTYDEGWALYAEQLRHQSGGFTPRQEIGYLVNQLWRASRLVVDTGLHTGTMSRANAERYFQKNTFSDKVTAKGEIQRYVDWPAQALAYYVGNRQVRQIRKSAEKILGKGFDERVFHAKLLSLGSVPLDDARKVMDSWARRRAGQLGKHRGLGTRARPSHQRRVRRTQAVRPPRGKAAARPHRLRRLVTRAR